MLIRPENLADYASLNTLHIRAFDNSARVATLVSLLRTRNTYKPDLSLVAEIDNTIVGHVVFSPINCLINGELVSGVNLSPLAVHPEYQKQGIGGALTREGHKICERMGYDFSILLGHPTYYPRFGYQTKAYGASSITVNTENVASMPLEMASPIPDDVPVLAELLLDNERDVDLTLIPENTLAEWLSPNPTVPCTVYRHEGDIVGYTRGGYGEVRLFLARDKQSAQAIAKQLAGDKTSIELPLHPNSGSASAFTETAEVSAWDAGMICPFRANSPVNDYLARDSVGRVIWFSVFDIA
ncbi:MAG: hypothetical protein Phog2KO_25120 [Phototrophicaceae bacterium]